MSEQDPMHIFQEGDVIYSQEGNTYYPAKILKIDLMPDGSIVWHKMFYKSQDSIPTVEQIPQMEIFMMHAPVMADSDAHFLLHTAVTEDDLEGYKYYLENPE